MWHAVSVRSLRVAQDRLFAALRTTTGWHRPLPATYEQEREPGIAALGGASLTPTHLAGRGVACGALACPTRRSKRRSADRLADRLSERETTVVTLAD